MNEMQNKEPLISIISAIRNQEEYLPELLHSIETQTNKNFEHIIIEGESTDNTPLILEQYYERNKENYPITIKRSSPKGISDGMNQGLNIATGDWIIIIHGDDYLFDETATQRLEEHIKTAKETKWLVGDTTRRFWWGIFTTPTFLIKPLLFWLLPYYNFLNHQNMIMHSSIFKEFGSFDTNYKITMDLDLYLRIIKKGIRPTAMPGTFTVFRRHPKSLSTNNSLVFKELKQVHRNFKKI